MSHWQYFNPPLQSWLTVPPCGAVMYLDDGLPVRLTGPLAICAGCKGDVAVGNVSSFGTPWCGAGGCLTIINTTSTRSEG